MKHPNSGAEDAFEKARSAFFGKPGTTLNTGATSGNSAKPQNEPPASERSSQPADANVSS